MKDVNDTYTNSYYIRLNDLSDKGYENAARGYHALYNKFMPRDKNARILDIGCGAGQFLYYLKKRGYKNHYGIDISKPQLDYCRRITDSVEVADLSDFLADRKGAYDLIVMNDLLEHIARDKVIHVLKLINESLDTGGAAIVKVPNMANPFGLVGRYMDITHESGFTEHSLRTALYAAGFGDISCHPAGASMNSVGGFLGKMSETLIHGCIRLLYRAQGYPVPGILTANLIGVARKCEE